MLNPLIHRIRVYASMNGLASYWPMLLLLYLCNRGKQLKKTTTGSPERYVRKGTAVVLLAYDLDSGQRYVQVRQRRTKRDYAEFMHQLRITHYPSVNQVHVLQDNLNTHQAGSFYDRFDAVTAHELANHFVFHYTPTHGSWLNMAEPGGRSHRVCGLIQTVLRPTHWGYILSSKKIATE